MSASLGADVPKISEFFGIKIFMYFEDHPPPHFHAQYAEFEATIRIEDLSVLRGGLPARALGLVVEWATLHTAELAENWRLAESNQMLVKIDPLQ